MALTFGQLNFLNSNLLHILFPDSKGAKYTGAPESVQIQDRLLIDILSKWASGRRHNDLVFELSYAKFSELLKFHARFFGLISPRLTPHGLRRGGGTWFFRLHGSYDRLAAHGRWSQVKSARQYVDVAMADRAWCELSGTGARRAEVAAACLPGLLAAL